MLYRKVPKTGDELSILGFGCMRLPLKLGGIDVKRATAQLHRAIDKGVNYVDTALPYHGGASEPFLGRALTRGYRDKVRVATKLPPWLVRRRADMDTLLRGQLENLASERIEYYLLHALEARSWKRMQHLDVLGFLDRARSDGRIGCAGFSFHGDRGTFKEIVNAFDWDFCQIQYNYLDEENQAGTEGLEYAASKGLGVIVMEPLRGGNLSGRVPARVQAVWDEASIRRTPAEWALRWVWDRPEVTVVLSGMNEEAHIEENLRIASEAHPGALTAAEMTLIGRVRDTYRRLMHADCTGCQYCMPCPHGVDIPSCFEMFNNLHMFGDQRSRFCYLFRIGGAAEVPSLASRCERCGVCETKCPQHLPIPDLLQDVVRDFEGRWTGPVTWGIKRFSEYQRWSALRRPGRTRR